MFWLRLEALDLGEYAKIPLAHAVRGGSLARCSAIVEACLNVAPSGMLKYSDLAQALRSLVDKYPGLNDTKKETKVWCADMTERIFVLLAHTRRIHGSVRPPDVEESSVEGV